MLPAVLAVPEIARELEKKDIRLDVIEKETSERAQRIWEVVAARTDAYDATEKTIESVQNRARIPAAPRYLKWIHGTVWTLVSLVLVAGFATAVFGMMKGWGAVALVLTRFLSWRNWALIVGNLIAICAVLLAWHRYRSRFLAAMIGSAEDELKAQLAPLKQQLEADRKIADQSLEQAVTSEVREIISQKTVGWFGTALPDSNAEGLSQVQNPEFEITTAAGERLRRIKDHWAHQVCLRSPPSLGECSLGVCPSGLGVENDRVAVFSALSYVASYAQSTFLQSHSL